MTLTTTRYWGLNKMVATALGDFRIIDLSTGIAGPFCTKLFADYGADLIKVEPTGGGDPARNLGPFFKDDPHPEKCLLFLYLNCNKRGITLNLESAAGRKILLELVKGADALIESFPPGYLAKLGLGYEELEKVNPRLVMTSITPFGQTGPYMNYIGNDLVYYGMSGTMYTSGAYDREPLKHGHSQSFYIGGIQAAYATSAALFSRALTDEGQHIDLSLGEAMTAHGWGVYPQYVYAGMIERRAPKVEGGSVKGTGLAGIVRVKDGYVGATDRAPGGKGGSAASRLIQYAELLGRPDLAGQLTEVADSPKGVDDLLFPMLREWNKFDYFHKVMSNGGSAAVVQSSEDLVNCPQLEERDYYTEVDHPVIGKIKMPGEIFQLPGCPWSLRFPAPLLGQHNEAIYSGDLGYAKQDLVQLRQQGAI
jgi:CoA:oxalate CoA-transferase